MAVKQVHKRAGEQEQDRQILDDVSTVLRDLEIGGDKDESPKDPASGAAAARAVISVSMVSHAASLLASARAVSDQEQVTNRRVDDAQHISPYREHGQHVEKRAHRERSGGIDLPEIHAMEKR